MQDGGGFYYITDAPEIDGGRSSLTEGRQAVARVEVTPADTINLFEVGAPGNSETSSVDQVWTDALAQMEQLGIAQRVRLSIQDVVGNNRRLAGIYRSGVIEVALSSPQAPSFTISHEAVHALREMGLFLPAEWTALEKAARADADMMASIRRRYPDLSEAEQVEEAIADRYARWAQGRQEKGFAARAFERIRDFFRALGQALRRNRFTTAEDVMRAIESGRVGRRNRQGLLDRSSGDRASSPQQDIFPAEFMAQLADNDELFQNPVSTRTTLEGVFSDIDPSITPVHVITDAAQEKNGPYADRLEDMQPAERVHVFATAKGKRFFIAEDGDNVWIDVSRLKEGDGGSGIYSAVADYAFNTGRVFIGDPAGLSDTALRRRTDAMLSSAIKHGATRHLAPHQRQRDGDAALGVPPLPWEDGNHVANIQSMIDVSLASLFDAVPDISHARYDFSTGAFRTGEGQPLTDGLLKLWSSSPRVRAAGAGRTTIKRGILLNSLAQAQGGARPGLLERALQQQHQLVASGLDRTFYSISRNAAFDRWFGNSKMKQVWGFVLSRISNERESIESGCSRTRTHSLKWD